MLSANIQSASPETLDSLLTMTFRFIAVKALRVIPISIINALPKIPTVYLKALSDIRLRDTFNVSN